MSDPSWRIDEADPETLAAGSRGPGLVSLHFLFNALRRRWRIWVGLGCVGMLLGAALTVRKPPEDVGTVTLLLAHDPATDPVEAMATDASLLRTATVADNVIRRLHLHMSPYAFQTSVVAQEASTSVLVLEVPGPNGAAAVARANALSDSYLTFRAAQIRSQSDTLARGYEKRIAALRQQSQELQRQYDAMRTSPADSGRASALLNKQSQVGAAIENAQQAIQDASLKTDFVIAASHVIDPPAAKPSRPAWKGLLLAVASGLIGGTAIGVVFVLVMALIDDRLRLRQEVALALDAPVRISVGRLQRRRPWWPLRRVARRSRDLQLLVNAVEEEISHARSARPAATARPGRPGEMARKACPTRLALAATDDIAPARLVIAGLAARLSSEGLEVFVVDLSDTEGLEADIDAALGQQEDLPTGPAPVLYRPEGVPSLARGPVGLSTASSTDLLSADPRRASWEQAAVALTLVEVDPAIGVEHVRSWADEVIVLVTAGRSSGERLRTISELIRAAGLRLLSAMLVGSDGTDNSAGLPEPMVSHDPRYAAGSSR